MNLNLSGFLSVCVVVLMFFWQLFQRRYSRCK